MARKTKAQSSLDKLAPVVERPKSKRGRPAREMPELDEFVANWHLVQVGEDRLVPGTEKMRLHADLTLVRYHLKKRFEAAGVPKEAYETWHAEPGLGITKKR